MNVTELEQLVHLVQGANISELTLRHNGARVTIRKAALKPNSGGELMVIDQAGNAPSDFTLDMAPDSEAEETDNAISVTSPLVGTFRPAQNPVGLGALVQAGQVIGIIEAMKLPNEVMASCAGKVVEVLVEDGQFVEYGQELFVIQPDNPQVIIR